MQMNGHNRVALIMNAVLTEPAFVLNPQNPSRINSQTTKSNVLWHPAFLWDPKQYFSLDTRDTTV